MGRPDVESVRCYYRITSQELSFAQLEMKLTDGPWYHATIPGEEIHDEWDMMVFFEVMTTRDVGFRFPDWRLETPLMR